MITYKYEAISQSGVAITGIIKAIDKSDAIIKLKSECTIVNSLTEIKEKPSLFGRKGKTNIKDKSLSLMCRQFSIILSAGIPIMRSVELVANQMNDRGMKRLLNSVSEDVAAGMSMSDSFNLRGPDLPPTLIETLKAGEASGALEETFMKLSEFYSKKSKVKSKVISALTYPAFVIGVAVIVIGIIMVFAVPTFARVFEGMGIELPLATRIIIGLSEFFANWFWLVLLILLVLIVGLRFYTKSASGGVKMAKFMLKLPLVGKIQLMNASSQFANTLATLLTAGLPAAHALGITGKTLSNKFLSLSVMESLEDVEAGYRIGTSLERRKAFPDLLVEMTGVGEESGSMETTLEVIGDYYDNEVEVTTNRAISLLEPIIICVLAIFVIIVLLSVYLPMFSLYDSIG